MARVPVELRNRHSLSLCLPVLSILVAFGPGCRILSHHAPWQLPPVAEVRGALIENEPLELAYAEAVRLEELHLEECVDLYAEVAMRAWSAVEQNLCRGAPENLRHQELYHSALSKLLMTAERHGRFDPQTGLRLEMATGPVSLPVQYSGFTWQPADFRVLTPVGDYPRHAVTNVYRRDGLGVTLMARARAVPRSFMKPNQLFAATAVLQPTGPAEKSRFKLAFYNPIYISKVVVHETHVPLARDITAPIAYLADRNGGAWFQNFIQTGSSRGDRGLFMIEPYQPGKIPVVFVHGLLSDPTTWADLGNELRSHPELMERYQFWTFNYDTGAPFLEGAAQLRDQLQRIRATLDPQRRDAALGQMMLVGHSMGGLISKLQVASSGDQLWQAVSRKPLSQIKANDQTRDELSRYFFFDRSPDVSRVVFIGTPHRGSAWAQRCIGRLGSALVTEPDDRMAQHRDLIQANPGVFLPEVMRRIPTSIDLLEPDSRLSNAILRLPLQAEAHTILGWGYWMPGEGDSDLVVAVTSSSIGNVSSEVRVVSTHTQIHRQPESVIELLRILREHHLQAGTRQLAADHEASFHTGTARSVESSNRRQLSARR